MRPRRDRNVPDDPHQVEVVGYESHVETRAHRVAALTYMVGFFGVLGYFEAVAKRGGALGWVGLGALTSVAIGIRVFVDRPTARRKRDSRLGEDQPEQSGLTR